MDSSKTAYQNNLQSIINAAESLKLPAYAALCKAGKLPRPSSPGIDVDNFAIPSPFFPIPDSITSSLISTGCASGAARSLSDAFLRAAHQINDSYQTTYRKSYKALAQQMSSQPSRLAWRLDHVRSAFERQYRDRILAAEQLAMDRAQSYQLAARVLHTKPAFNQEFVPFLEKYFEYNAYPSAPDRIALARKSMMTPRQIEVWFQNHRNRSKKEGKPLRRLNLDPLPLKLSLDSLEARMPFFVIPEHQRKESSREKSLVAESSDDDGGQDQVKGKTPVEDPHHAFSIHAPPPHVFPISYPPTCNYDPFPCKTGNYVLPVPVWRRKPATTRPTTPAEDFDDFVTAFSNKLVLREVSAKQPCHDSPNTTEKCPWYSLIYTTASPAPHPAFIRIPTFLSVTSNPPAPLPAVSAPSSCHHPFRSPSPSSRFTSLVPPAQSDNLARRKVARLPRRTQKDGWEAYRSRSPTTSAGSPSLSDSWSSTTPSS